MVNRHLDNLGGIERWLESLDTEERAIFEQGYQQALAKMIDQLRRSKIKLLNKLCEIDEEGGSRDHKMQLEAKEKVLDLYDNHFTSLLGKLAEKSLLPFGEETKVE